MSVVRGCALQFVKLMTRNKTSEKDDLEAAWKHLDADGDGEITVDELSAGV